MNITHPTQQSPFKRNGATAYVRRYLNAVSDWQTYAGVDPTRPQAAGDIVRQLTADYFSPGKLKGIALLLAAHLTQQAVSGLATALIRTTRHGDPLDTVHGIAVRQSNYHHRWNRLRPDRLANVAEMTDSYYFHEGGRTWSVWTLTLHLWGETRRLSALTLLSLPNRAFYFDRPLDYPQAVPLALGLATADSIPGFLGDVNELDGLVPPLRALKLGLYLLNWLLVDPSERDSGLPSPTPYSDLTPPSGGTRPQPAAPPRNPGDYKGYYGSYFGAAGVTNPYPPAYPNGNGISTQSYPPAYPNGNGVSTQSYPPAYPNGNGMPSPHPAYANGPAPAAIPPTTLLEQPVSVLIRVNGREQWHTVNRNAFVVTAAGHDTGLAITPSIETLADGRIVEDDRRWNITHLGSGRQLNQVALPTRDRAQALAAALLVIDWTRAVDDIPSTDLDRAQAIIATAVTGGGNYVQ